MDFWLNWFSMVFKDTVIRCVRKTAKAITNFVMSVLPSVCSSVYLFVRPHGTTQFPLDTIFMKLDILVLLITCRQNLTFVKV
jgi:hypothetical protein